jgi:hypothetical protein
MFNDNTSEKDRIIQRDRLELDENIYGLDSAKFAFAIQTERQKIEASVKIEEIRAQDSAAQREWERAKQNKEIELLNARNYAQVWSACLSATALTQQPVGVDGAIAAAINQFGNPEFGSVKGGIAQGADTILCKDYFADLDIMHLITTETLEMPNMKPKPDSMYGRPTESKEK